MDPIVASWAALSLGLTTSISPCPLATNIAAVSFVSYRTVARGSGIVAGLAYTLGRSLTYVVVGFLAIQAVVRVSDVSYSLQSLNRGLGLVLIVVGMALLGLIQLPRALRLPSLPLQSWANRLTDGGGAMGAFGLGALFALAFCPLSAALFFGGLVPLASDAGSSLGLPLLYGVGTGVPVLGFALLVALGTRYVDPVYRALSRLTAYAQPAIGVVFIGIGLYYVLAYTFKVL